jgi:hypothetical protein
MSARNERGRFARRDQVVQNNAVQEAEEEIESPITKNNILILVFCIFIGYIIFRKGYVDNAINESDSMFSRIGDILANSVGCSYGCFKKLVWDTKEEILKVITPDDDIMALEAELLRRKNQQYPSGAHIIPANNNNKNFQQQSQGGIFVNQQQARTNAFINPNNQNYQQQTQTNAFINPNNQNPQHTQSNTFINPNNQNYRQAQANTYINPNNPNPQRQQTQTNAFINQNNQNPQQQTQSNTLINPNNQNQNQYYNQQQTHQTNTNLNREAQFQGGEQRNTGFQSQGVQKNSGVQAMQNDGSLCDINASFDQISSNNRNNQGRQIIGELNKNPNAVSQDFINNVSQHLGSEFVGQFMNNIAPEFLEKVGNSFLRNRENSNPNQETNPQNQNNNQENRQNNISDGAEDGDVVIEINSNKLLEGSMEAPMGKKNGKGKGKQKTS